MFCASVASFGNNGVKTPTASSVSSAFMRFCEFSNESAVFTASPMASLDPAIKRLSLALTFSSLVISLIFLRMPMRLSSACKVASVMTIPNRLTASWLPTKADWNAAITSGSWAFWKDATSVASFVNWTDKSAASPLAKPRGTKVS